MLSEETVSDIVTASALPRVVAALVAGYALTNLLVYFDAMGRNVCYLKHSRQGGGVLFAIRLQKKKGTKHKLIYRFEAMFNKLNWILVKTAYLSVDIHTIDDEGTWLAGFRTLRADNSHIWGRPTKVDSLSAMRDTEVLTALDIEEWVGKLAAAAEPFRRPNNDRTRDVDSEFRSNTALLT